MDDPEHKAYAQWFRDAWATTGKKLDMGKSCIRFTKVDDLALDVIGQAIKKVPAKRFIEGYEAALGDRAKKPAAKADKAKTTTKAKPAAKKKASAKAAAPVRKATGKK